MSAIVDRTMNHFRVVGHIQKQDGQVVDRVMAVSTKKSYDEVTEKVEKYLLRDGTEKMLGYTIVACAPFEAVQEVALKSEEPVTKSVVELNAKTNWQRAMENAAEATARFLAAKNGNNPLPPEQAASSALIVVPKQEDEIKIPEGIVDVKFEKPTTVALNADSKESEGCLR